MSLTEDALPTEIRLRRGAPTRIRIDGTSYMLGIHGVAPDTSSVTIGVHIDGTGVTTRHEIDDPVAVGTATYIVTHITGAAVTLSRPGAA